MTVLRHVDLWARPEKDEVVLDISCPEGSFCPSLSFWARCQGSAEFCSWGLREESQRTHWKSQFLVMGGRANVYKRSKRENVRSWLGGGRRRHLQPFLLWASHWSWTKLGNRRPLTINQGSSWDCYTKLDILITKWTVLQGEVAESLFTWKRPEKVWSLS